MIVIRDVIKLKFGKAKDAIALWKEGKPIFEKFDRAPMKMMTDYVGEFYTIVMEAEYSSFSEFEEAMKSTFSNEEYRTWYQKFIPLAESGYREIFKVVEA